MSYLQENIDKIKSLKSELSKVLSETNEQLAAAQAVIDRSESVGLELQYEMPDIGMWAKGALDFGFDDHDESERDDMEELVNDIYEYANQISFILSDEYKELSSLS